MNELSEEAGQAEPLRIEVAASGASEFAFSLPAFLSLSVGLLALRITLWPLGDNGDLHSYFLRLQTLLIERGRWHAMRQPLSDYFPAYFDLATLTSYLDGRLSRTAQIKLVPFCFDILAAFVASRIAMAALGGAGSARRRIASAAAALAVLAGPTVIVDGSLWGQCDVIYTTFLLLTVLAVLRKNGARAVLAFGFALAFKLQSVFLIPFLLAMVLRRSFKLWHLSVLPVGWLVALVPTMVQGGDVIAFLKLPLTQGGEYKWLSINAANLCMVGGMLGIGYRAGTLLALFLAALAGGALIYWGSRSVPANPAATLSLAALSLIAMPYFLPRMHDRYFFPAEVLLSVAACVDGALVIPAGLLITSSLICYSNYFADTVRYGVTIAAVLMSTGALVLTLKHLIRLSRSAEAREFKEASEVV